MVKNLARIFIEVLFTVASVVGILALVWIALGIPMLIVLLYLNEFWILGISLVLVYGYLVGWYYAKLYHS